MIHSSPLLKKKKSSGKGFVYWQMFAEILSTGQVVTYTQFYQDVAKNQPTIQRTPYTYIEPKNVGKSNETSLWEQAIFEVASLEKKKQDEGFSETGENSSVILPMLAKKYHEEFHKINFPVEVQVKYNGNRSLSNGEKFTSRKGLPFIDEVIQHLKFENSNNYLFDGEILLDGIFPLQEVNKHLRKVKPENKKLIYVIYDIVSKMPYSDKLKIIREFVASQPNPNIRVVESYTAYSSEEIFKIHSSFVSIGHEGSIIRWGNAPYMDNLRRSDNLLKLKDFEDEEFECIDIIDGTGKSREHAILVCICKGGTFEVVPEGEMSRRSHIFHNKKDYIGKKWTVKHYGYTNAGIPMYATAIDVRDDI